MIRKGRFAEWSPNGFTTALSVGNSLLPLADPAPKSHPRANVTPGGNGEIVIEVRGRR